MKIRLRTIPFFIATALLLSLATPSLAEAKNEIYTNWQGIAIKGYDPVADLFQANPEQYAPQYGGYCAWAVAQGTTASVDPKNAWNIVEGKLYLNYNKEIKAKWEQDIPGNIEKADNSWPSVLK